MTHLASTLAAALTGLALVAGAAVADTAITIGTTTRLIRAAEKNVADANGWAFDMHDALDANSLPATRENVCAVIAVIDQESSFNADPAVPGLGTIAEKAIRDRFAGIPVAGSLAIRWLERTPTPDASFMARIRRARTEHDLDLAYRALVDYAGKTSNLDVVMRLGVLNSLIEERNQINTAGSMQVSVKFAMDEARKTRWLPMSLDDAYAVRDQLYTRRGGMYYGIRQLLGYDTGYSQKIFRFADYNAGRFAARNAAFQQVAQRLSGEKLSLDGDLLGYGKDGNPLPKATDSEKAVRNAVSRHQLGLDAKQIRADLAQEKRPGFTATRTYIMLRDRYAQVTGKPAPFAALPQIALKSAKMTHGYSTARFADSVNRKYQACMAVK